MGDNFQLLDMGEGGPKGNSAKFIIFPVVFQLQKQL